MREKLPNRRPNSNQTLLYEVGPGQKIPIDISLGYDEEGRIREVFTSTRKLGTAIDRMARDATILISFLLQYGCDLQEVRDVLSSDVNGNPESLAGTVIDLIMKENNDG